MVSTQTGEDYPPELSVLVGKEIVDLSDDVARAKNKAKFYSGCFYYFQVCVMAYDGGNSGVCCYLEKVLTTNKGEKRGGSGGASAKETFSQYIGKQSAEDPTDGIDDEDDY
jgi:hypothetical protein